MTMAPAVPPAPIRPNNLFALRIGKCSEIATQNPDVSNTVPSVVQR